MPQTLKIQLMSTLLCDRNWFWFSISAKMIRYKRVYEYSLTTEAALLDNNETTAKSTTQDGGMAETSVNAFV